MIGAVSTEKLCHSLLMMDRYDKIHLQAFHGRRCKLVLPSENLSQNFCRSNSSHKFLQNKIEIHGILRLYFAVKREIPCMLMTIDDKLCPLSVILVSRNYLPFCLTQLNNFWSFSKKNNFWSLFSQYSLSHPPS